MYCLTGYRRGILNNEILLWKCLIFSNPPFPPLFFQRHKNPSTNNVNIMAEKQFAGIQNKNIYRSCALSTFVWYLLRWSVLFVQYIFSFSKRLKFTLQTQTPCVLFLGCICCQNMHAIIAKISYLKTMFVSLFLMYLHKVY